MGGRIECKHGGNAMKGRKPTPTATLAARGSWRANLRSAEPMAPAGIPECPDDLQGEARAEWFRLSAILSGMGVLTLAERGALVCYCRAWARMTKAAAKLEVEGEVISSPSGYQIQSPWLAIHNKALEQVVKLLAEFGLTPASRTRVKTVAPSSPTNNLATYRINA